MALAQQLRYLLTRPLHNPPLHGKQTCAVLFDDLYNVDGRQAISWGRPGFGTTPAYAGGLAECQPFQSVLPAGTPLAHRSGH